MNICAIEVNVDTCLPILLSLRIMYIFQVALVEGSFQLFKSLLETFCSGMYMGLILAKTLSLLSALSLSTTVDDSEVFEFSDYLWALLISQSKVSSQQ